MLFLHSNFFPLCCWWWRRRRRKRLFRVSVWCVIFSQPSHRQGICTQSLALESRLQIFKWLIWPLKAKPRLCLTTFMLLSSPLLILNILFMQMFHYEPSTHRHDDGVTGGRCVLKWSCFWEEGEEKEKRKGVKEEEREHEESNGCVNSGPLTINHSQNSISHTPLFLIQPFAWSFSSQVSSQCLYVAHNAEEPYNSHAI